jgi:DNA-binding beta-propeller fold protein YncE
VVLALAACAPAALHAGAPLAVHVVADVPLGGESRRFESQSFDAKTGMLFIADFAGGRVVVFDTKTNRVVRIVRDLPSAQGILVVPELHRVFVSEPGAVEVAVIDETTYEVVARFTAGRYPSAMAWDPVRRKLYISDVIGQAETVIDARNNMRSATIPLGGEAGNVQFDRSENLVYVNVKTTNELVAIDPVLDAVVARYPLAGCRENAGLLIDDRNALAYVACRGNARLVTFDLRSHRQREAKPTGAEPDALAWDAATSLLYVACEGGTVSIFSVAGGRLRKMAEGVLAGDAHTVAVGTATHRAYFALHDAADRPVIRVVRSTPATAWENAQPLLEPPEQKERVPRPS